MGAAMAGSIIVMVAPAGCNMPLTTQSALTWHFPARKNLHQHTVSKYAGLEGVPRRITMGPILVVEDDPDILSTVADILEFEGYHVKRASNGAEGLAMMEGVHPALVILDMRMPILDGWDFARILREREIKVPILVMTAAQDARRWAQEIDAEGYVAKPFHILELISAVEELTGTGGSPPAAN
jgi:CheY-like chemotaxis protein